jgi:3-dehydroquinate synthase
VTNETVHVASARGGYDIQIGRGLIQKSALWKRLLGQRPHFIISNDTVWSAYGERLAQALPSLASEPFLMQDGERFKSLQSWQDALDAMLARGLTRDAVVVALGGGVVGDLAGFAAASYMRGIDIVQVPTTLLAQVDSSVGGKTGVNHRRGKNLIGAFHAPCAVVIDSDTLTSLPPRQRAAGLAEVVKYGLIDDADFFAWLEQNQQAIQANDSNTMHQAIAHSCRCKARVVAADEHERGSRALLNLGHTFAHALEAVSQYQRYLHGEAVAIGMLCAARMAVMDQLMPESQYQRIAALLAAFDLPTKLDEPFGDEQLVIAMHGDKKADRTGLKGIALPAIGAAKVVPFDEDQQLRRVWQAMGASA